MPKRKELAEIRELLATDKLRTAAERLVLVATDRERRNDISNLQGWLENIEGSNLKGTLDLETYVRERNKLRTRFFNLLTEMEEGVEAERQSVASLMQHAAKQPGSDILRWVLILMVMILIFLGISAWANAFFLISTKQDHYLPMVYLGTLGVGLGGLFGLAYKYIELMAAQNSNG